jgi:hypothetical protein
MPPKAGTELLVVCLASLSTNPPTALDTIITANITIVTTTAAATSTTTPTDYAAMVSPIPFATKTLTVKGDGTKLAALVMLTSPNILYKSTVVSSLTPSPPTCPFVVMYHTALTGSTAPTIANNYTDDGRTHSTITSAGGDELTLGDLLPQLLPLVPLLLFTVQNLSFTAKVTLKVKAPYHCRHFFHFLNNFWKLPT